MDLKKLLLIPALVTASVLPSSADEGMWLLPLLKQQNAEQLKAAGLSLDIDDIYNQIGRAHV